MRDKRLKSSPKNSGSVPLYNAASANNYPTVKRSFHLKPLIEQCGWLKKTKKLNYYVDTDISQPEY
jgi:hypothetical protein